ncbi:MAG: class I SAM-dependent methyltransferase [Clostridia bacterium]|nr:class I SAM-dependent methyltransferase [Clostridia bacterium]
MKTKEQFVGYKRHEYNPIIRAKTEELLVETLEKLRPKRILEIGTFIGYSAALMLEKCDECRVVTIEKDTQNAEDAKTNLVEFGGRVTVNCCDAMEFLKQAAEEKTEKFDFIFLDGPKGQYIRYLPFLKQILIVGGVLFVDDVLFYGLVNSDEKIAHKHRSIVNNLRKFLQALKEDEGFETTTYDFEDGVSVSLKIK